MSSATTLAAPAPMISGILVSPEPQAFATRYFPLGCPLDVTTNSPEIAETAARLWSRYPKLGDSAPCTLSVSVSPERAITPPMPALPQSHDHLVTIMLGPGNYAVADLAKGVAHIALTHEYTADPQWPAYHLLEPIVYMMLAAREFVYVHASCVAWKNRAVLLCGESGSGKTCLAYACARRGWRFLSGDATQIVRGANEPLVTGRPYSLRFRECAASLFPELRRYAPIMRPNGKRDIEPSSVDLGLALSQSASASHVILLNRLPGPVTANLTPVSTAAALRILEATICYGDADMRKQQQSALERFLAIPAFRLTWSAFGDAEAALRSLVDVV